MTDFQIIVLFAYLFVRLFTYWLEFLNLGHLKRYGDIIPSEFEGRIDQELLRKTRDYTVDRSRFGLIDSAFGDLLVILFFFSGILDGYNSWVASLDLPFILSGTLFFLLLGYVRSFLSIPFDLYGTFRIENRYGFNTMTGKLWVSDFLKSTAISTVLGGGAIAGAFYLIQVAPGSWWFFVWLFFLLFSLFMMYISPYVIEPLFHKFTPLGDEAMEGRIKEVMKKAGITVSRIFKIDASKRSRHTNAYFTGIGRVKRIVLYDTLIEKLSREEALSVLAHEAGHWKRKHVLKHIALVEVLSLIGLYVSFRIIRAGIPAGVFGLEHDTFFASLLIVGFIGGIVTFPLTPLMSCLSRRHEREADRFAWEMTDDPEAMATSLIKLSKDNLSNLHPHPLYATFYYSHPPVVERVRELREGKIQ